MQRRTAAPPHSAAHKQQAPAKATKRHNRANAVSQAYKNISQSPTVRLLVLAVTAGAISVSREEHMWLLVPLVFLVTSFRRIIFEVLLMVHVAQHGLGRWVWYHRVYPGIYLGSIPMESMGHLNVLPSQLGITHVLAINQDYELVAGTVAGCPVPPDAWKKVDVSFAQIRSDDFVPPSFEKLSEGADLIDAYIGDAKGKVYVHCKSGIGRSASLVIAYLVRHKAMTAVDAHALVKGVRPQIIGSGSGQYAQLVAYERFLRTEQL